MASDFPYGIYQVYDYEMVFIAELTAYIVIGGYDARGQWLSNIAMFANGAWSNAGHLNRGRDVSSSLILFLSIPFLAA